MLAQSAVEVKSRHSAFIHLAFLLGIVETAANQSTCPRAITEINGHSPIMSQIFFLNVSLAMGSVLSLLGLNALFRPENHLKRLGFPLPAETQAKKLSYALMRIWGVRNVSVGTLLYFIWLTGNATLMAKTLGIVTALPVVDGFVSRSLIGGGEFQHWMNPPILAVIIAGLLGYLEW